MTRIRALLPEDWRGRAGERFRQTAKAASEFAKEHHIQPQELADQAVELGRMKLEGLASKEYAAAVRDFKEAEQKEIETEFQRRSLESKVRKEEAEARLAEIKVLDAEVKLFKDLREIGVSLYLNSDGNYTVLPNLQGQLTNSESPAQLDDEPA